MGVAGGGSRGNQYGIWNRQLLRESGIVKTLEKYSQHATILNAGDAPATSANNFRQAGQKPIPKSLSVAGLLGCGLFLISSLSLRERYKISSHRREPWITGPRRLSFSSSRLILLREHSLYLSSKKASPRVSFVLTAPRVSYLSLR